MSGDGETDGYSANERAYDPADFDMGQVLSQTVRAEEARLTYKKRQLEQEFKQLQTQYTASMDELREQFRPRKRKLETRTKIMGSQGGARTRQLREDVDGCLEAMRAERRAFRRERRELKLELLAVQEELQAIRDDSQSLAQVVDAVLEE